jgi:hypothetical protein
MAVVLFVLKILLAGGAHSISWISMGVYVHTDEAMSYLPEFTCVVGGEL